MKAQLVTITYSCLVKQIIKLSPNLQTANNKLYSIGTQMGIRIADEYNDRKILRTTDLQTVRELIKGISEEYMGCLLSLQNQQIQMLKKYHKYSYKFSIKDNNLDSFLILPKQYHNLNYLSLFLGFLDGVLQTISLYGRVNIQRDALKQGQGNTIISINVQKQIKQQD